MSKWAAGKLEEEYERMLYQPQTHIDGVEFASKLSIGLNALRVNEMMLIRGSDRPQFSTQRAS